MLHQPHSGVTGPAFLVVVADYVLIVGIRVLGQISLDQITGFFCGKSVNMKTFNYSNIHKFVDGLLREVKLISAESNFIIIQMSLF